jgi:hypothetical protein
VNVLEGPDLDQQVDDVVNDLAREFGRRLDRERVREHVMLAYSAFRDARITAFVPLLTRRMARTSLRQLV